MGLQFQKAMVPDDRAKARWQKQVGVHNLVYD